MSVEFSRTEFKRGSEYLIAPSEIEVNPDLNGRVDLPDIEWLIKDFKQRGQLQPILIRNNGGRAALVAGHSRWRAGIAVIERRLIPDFKLRCVYFRGNEQDGFRANIAENRFRSATTALDDAHNIKLLTSWGQTIAEIAELYRDSEAWVRARLKMTELTPEAQQAVKEGRLKPTAAAHLAKLSSEQQRKAVAGKGKVKGKDVATPKTPKAAPGNAEAKLKRLQEVILKEFEESDPKGELRKFCERLLDLLALPF